jgi:CHAT domain-containing protein
MTSAGSPGLLHAGGRSVVASLWSADDAATAELMIGVYRNGEEHGAREAVRLAQLGTRDSHPAPMFCAAFEIMGSANIEGSAYR